MVKRFQVVKCWYVPATERRPSAQGIVRAEQHKMGLEGRTGTSHVALQRNCKVVKCVQAGQ